MLPWIVWRIVYYSINKTKELKPKPELKPVWSLKTVIMRGSVYTVAHLPSPSWWHPSGSASPWQRQHQSTACVGWDTRCLTVCGARCCWWWPVWRSGQSAAPVWTPLTWERRSWEVNRNAWWKLEDDNVETENKASYLFLVLQNFSMKREKYL